jgi:NodT family efflux transporter outer membrane factor (OMF) lipoprotein
MNKPWQRAVPLRAGLLALCVGLASCADMTGIAPQATVRDAASLGLTDGKAGDRVPAPVSVQWWRDFGDAQLDGLVEQALANNPGLKVAQARLARAMAVTEMTRGAGGPQLAASLDLMHQRYTANGAVPPPLAGAISDSATLQLGASWELDFFGRNQAALEAALGGANASLAEAQAARVLLAANVARSYFQLLRLHEQLGVAHRALAQREEILKLVRQRVHAELDSRLELQQSLGSLPEMRRQIESLLEQDALTRHALAALVGRPDAAEGLVLPALDAVHVVAVAPVLPADLLGRRADVAAARWRVEAGQQDVVQARARFYPNVNLVAFAGFSSIGPDRLLESGSQQWGVGPALRLPLFDGGQLRANLRGRSADLDAAVESYNATVIEAVREVADQIASMQSITRQQDEQRAAQQAAQYAYALSVQRYQAGLGNYLLVLNAETAVLAQRRLAVDLAARVLDNRVALMRALGGGYQAEQVAVGGDARTERNGR